MSNEIWIMTGIIGIGLMVSILYFLYKSEQNKKLPRIDYKKKVNSSFLIMMTLIVLFSICLSLVMDIEILPSMMIGIAFLAIVVIYIYLKPNGLGMKWLSSNSKASK
jgi:hypothetical protein